MPLVPLGRGVGGEGYHIHRLVFILSALAFLLVIPSAFSHPIIRSVHDRTILVQLVSKGSNRLSVFVHYRVEVDELTVVLEDMVPFSDQVDYSRYRDKRNEFYTEYTRCYAPIFAANLVGKAGNTPLTFRCTKRSHTLHDEKNEPLGHLRCDFVFEAECEMPSTGPLAFSLRESNFELQTGKIDVSLIAGSGIKLDDKKEASKELKERKPTEWKPGDEDKLRTVSALVTMMAQPSTHIVENTPVELARSKGHETDKPSEHSSGLYRLFLDGQYSVPLLLILAAAFGAVHALTPGHGKTLVAAYLVGERGTIFHAIVLGVVTTITHTSSVLLIAILLLFAGDNPALKSSLQYGLGLGMGMLVLGLGFWLLLKRLSGGADHVHIGGSGHHHHHHHHHGHHHHHHHHGHTHADHIHDEHGNVVVLDKAEPISWWGLIVLGMTGGIIPCWDSIVLLLMAVRMDLFWLALPMILAFSAGLAAVLVVIGILVVSIKGFAQSRYGNGAIVRSLPIISAIIIIAMGFWLCYDSVYGLH